MSGDAKMTTFRITLEKQGDQIRVLWPAHSAKQAMWWMSRRYPGHRVITVEPVGT